MPFEIPPYFQQKVFLKVLSWEKKHWLFALSSFLAGIAVLAFYFQSGHNEASYFLAENTFAKWKLSPKDEILFSEVEKMPLLKEKYQAPIAQALLEKNALEKALPLAVDPLKKLGEEAPFHALFAESSLLIAQEAYKEALEKALSLKEQIENSLDLDTLYQDPLSSYGPLLYIENLLRIAFLEQKEGNSVKEKAAWLAFEREINKNASLKRLIYQSFEEKFSGLTDYIEWRKKNLP